MVMFRRKGGAENTVDIFSVLGGVAHLVERYIRIVEVVSSSLIVSTNRVPRYADAYSRCFFFCSFFSRVEGEIIFIASLYCCSKAKALCFIAKQSAFFGDIVSWVVFFYRA